MRFLVHTMEYKGGHICEKPQLRNYSPDDYDSYERIYEDCFYDMRSSLGLERECCKSRDELLANRDNIFILEENGSIIGSVAVYGNEIDDLFVAHEYQQRGFGLILLRYAIAVLQERSDGRIILHVADVNEAAMSMYLANGFVIAETEEINI